MIDVVHLVWGPLGPAALDAFVDSYRRHEPGAEHQLTILYNGVGADDELGAWRTVLAGIEHAELRCPQAVLDLAAYRFALDRLRGRFVCFLNSYSAIEADGWLAIYESQLSRPEVGIVGAGGSYESGWDTAPLRLRRLLRGGFEPFPNPHIRTNAFALRLELARQLDWPPPRRKRDAHLLESGRHGLTRQVLARGLEAIVVGRDGRAYPPERWRESATFRSGGQRNALITDNRTRQYAQASPALRATLERMCWGAPE